VILGQSIKIVATSCQILRLQCTKFDFGWGSAKDHAGGACSTRKTFWLDLSCPTSKEREGRGTEGDAEWKKGGGKGKEQG